MNCQLPTKSLLQYFMAFMQIFDVNSFIFFLGLLCVVLLSCIMQSLKMNSQNKNISYWKPYLKINGVLAKDCFPRLFPIISQTQQKLHKGMVNQLKTAFLCALSTFGAFDKNAYSCLSYRGLHTQTRQCKGGLKLPCPLCSVLPAGGTARNALPLTALKRIGNNFLQILVLWTNYSFSFVCG